MNPLLQSWLNAQANIHTWSADVTQTRALKTLTQPLVEGALERGFVVRSPVKAEDRGGHVTIDPGDAQNVHDELIARGFSVDYRPGVGIRVGPHFYNSADECTAVLDAMAEIRGH